ncbi:MAG: hypothetical protein ACI4SH_05505 [Candidatus Scatosoma sp.]
MSDVVSLLCLTYYKISNEKGEKKDGRKTVGETGENLNENKEKYKSADRAGRGGKDA